MRVDLLKWRRAGALAAWAAIGLIAGCDKPAADSPKASAPVAALSISHTPVSAPAAPKPEMPEGKICFGCDGTGTIKCLAPGCRDGMVDCPGPCLKLTRGTWIHMPVDGHPPTDVWQKFYQGDGSYAAYDQDHVGHVIAMQNGRAVDTGACPVCGGSGKVPCKVCNGTGRQTCLICAGKKYIPAAWTPTDNPWLDRQPDLIRLANGGMLFGKIIQTNGAELSIKTRAGKWLHLGIAEVLPPAESVATNAVTP